MGIASESAVPRDGGQAALALFPSCPPRWGFTSAAAVWARRSSGPPPSATSARGLPCALATKELDATVLRPARKDEPDNSLHLSTIRQCIESILWTCKDILDLERHGARTLDNLRVRIAQRSLALTAAIALNHRLRRPSGALVTPALTPGIKHLDELQLHR